MKVLQAPSPTDWKVYTVALQKKSGFDAISVDKLFYALKADQYDIKRTEESSKAEASKEQAQVSTYT